MFRRQKLKAEIRKAMGIVAETRGVAKCSRRKDSKLVGVEGVSTGLEEIGLRLQMLGKREEPRPLKLDDLRRITEAVQTNIKCQFTLSMDRTW